MTASGRLPVMLTLLACANGAHARIGISRFPFMLALNIHYLNRYQTDRRGDSPGRHRDPVKYIPGWNRRRGGGSSLIVSIHSTPNGLRPALSASVHEFNSENGFVLQNGHNAEPIGRRWPRMHADTQSTRHQGKLGSFCKISAAGMRRLAIRRCQLTGSLEGDYGTETVE
jgi:hypothetical protein